MAAFTKVVNSKTINFHQRINRHVAPFSSIISQINKTTEEKTDGEFRVLEIQKKEKPRPKKWKIDSSEIMPPRSQRMAIDQDWSNVWPTATSFKSSVVPFPVRMGYPKKKHPNPGKYGNAELMKIPNFLHLTPPAIKKQCAAIKKFCTEWPKELKTDEDCEKNFPVEITTNDYCHSASVIRDVRARIIVFQVKVSSLNLDYHGYDKLLRLVGSRYDKSSDILTLITDRCPLKKQNIDYAKYLLTVLYHEAKKTEQWEAEKTEADMEKYFWDISLSKKSVIELMLKINEADKSQHHDEESEEKSLPISPTYHLSEEELLQVQEVKEYAEAVTNLHNEGENNYTINKYKNSIKNLLNLQPFDMGT